MPTKQEAGATQAQPAAAEARPAQADRKSPEQWAKVAFPADKKGRRPANFWQHAAAAALHGWAEHAHHEGKPLELTGEDYYQALVAASQPRAGRYQPHAAALSNHAASKRKES